MYSALNKILKDVERETGVKAVVFSDQGVILSASCEECVPSFPMTGLGEGAFSQGGFYFYPSKNGAKRCVIAIPDGENAPIFAPLLSHAVQNCLIGSVAQSATDLLHTILAGNGDAADVKRLKDEFGYPQGRYFVMALNSFKSNEGLTSVLSVLADSKYDYVTMTESGILAFVKHVFSEELSPMDFAHSVAESVFAETGVKLSVCATDFTDLDGIADGYASALIGLKTAFRMNYTKQVFSYRDFLVVDLLASLPEKELETQRKSIIKPAFIATVEDAELSETAEAFFNCSLNVSETARSLFIHRNTLMYRLNKIEKETGLNIRNFSDALAFRVMQMLYKTGVKDE